MIRHCVLVNYQPGFSAAARDAIVADLGALRRKLSGMHAVLASRNVSPEGLGRGFGDGFTIDFDDAAARDAYLADRRRSDPDLWIVELDHRDARTLALELLQG